MPSKCCVPMCTSGYVLKNKISEKIPMFTTKDKKLQLKWSKAIPRKNYKVNDKSCVCAHHFTEADIKKGFYIQVGDQKIFQEQRWSLQPNSIPTIFPNCPGHLSKETKKVELDDNDGSVSKKVKLDQQFATERSTAETTENIIQLESETKEEVTQCEDDTFQFNARRHDNQVVDADNQVDATMQLDTERDTTQLENVNWEKDIENFVFPYNWSYCKMDEEFHIYKVGKDKGKLSIEKNVVLSNGILSYEVKEASMPRNEEMLPSLLTSIDMLKNVINTFEKLEICGGISLVSHSQDVQEKLKLQQVIEGYEECNVWRSYSCRRVLQLMSSKYPNQRKYSACLECRNLKITLSKHIWNFKRRSLSKETTEMKKGKKQGTKDSNTEIGLVKLGEKRSSGVAVESSC